jgi:hypothetical protein
MGWLASAGQGSLPWLAWYCRSAPIRLLDLVVVALLAFRVVCVLGSTVTRTSEAAISNRLI